MTEKQIREILSKLGVSPAYKGYHYLIYAIRLATEQGNSLCPATKYLYAVTAVHFNVSPEVIQHSIRTVLEAYWNQGNSEHFTQIIGYPVNVSLPPKEFIAVIADYLIRLYT